MMVMGNSNYLKMFLYHVLLMMQMMMILFLEPKKRLLVNANSYDDIIVSANSEQDGTYLVPNFCKTRSNFLLPPYNDLPKFICSPLDWHGFTIAFRQEDAVVTIVASGMDTSSWVGVGVSKNGKMIGASAVVGWMGGQNGNTSIIKQYSLEGHFNEQVVPDKGVLKFSKNAPVLVVKDKVIYLAFQLQFPEPLGDLQPFIFAHGDGKPAANYILPKHVYRTAMAVDFHRGTLSLGFVDSKDVKKTHGLLSLIGWGALLPIGVGIARYMRDCDPLWYYLHSAVQFVGFFVGLSSVAVGRTLYELLNADFQTHRSIGFLVLALTVLQVCQFIVRSSSVGHYWNVYHRWVGRVTMALGVVNIVIGLYVGHGDVLYKTIFWCIIVVIVGALIYLELRLQRNKTREPIDNFSEPPIFRVGPNS